MALISVNACDDDDDDIIKGDTSTSTATATADLYYGFECGEDIDLMDIVISYTEADGTDTEVTLEDTTWEKTVSGAVLPFTANFTVTYTAKSDITFDKESYAVARGYTVTYKTSTGKGGGPSSSSSYTVSKDKIEAYIESSVNNGINYSITIE